MPQYPEHVSRFYSIALGKCQNFNAVSNGIISAGDGSPSVATYSLLYNVTNGALTLSYLDDGVEGQVVVLINIGSQIVLSTGGVMKVESNALPVNSTLTLINHNSSWYQLAYSSNI